MLIKKPLHSHSLLVALRYGSLLLVFLPTMTSTLWTAEVTAPSEESPSPPIKQPSDIPDLPVDIQLAASTAAGMSGQLAPGDLIQVDVFDNPDLKTNLRIPNDGRSPFPLIGMLTDLTQKTPESLALEIRKKLENGYIRKAETTVTVLEYGPRMVYILGSIARPGNFNIPPSTPLSALQAIGQAGGFTEDSDRKRTVIVRQNVDGTATHLKPFEGTAGPETFFLAPGDVVLVPRSDRVYVLGRVQKPGPLSLSSEEPITVSRAVSMAGGFERFAKSGSVQLIRAQGDPVLVDIAALLKGEPVPDPILQPGDTIFVPQSRF